MGIVRLGCRSCTGQLLPATRGIGQGSGNRAKRTLTSIRGGNSAPLAFLGKCPAPFFRWCQQVSLTPGKPQNGTFRHISGRMVKREKTP